MFPANARQHEADLSPAATSVTTQGRQCRQSSTRRTRRPECSASSDRCDRCGPRHRTRSRRSMSGARRSPSNAPTDAVGPDGGTGRSHHRLLWLPDPCGSRSDRPAHTPTPLRPSRPGRNASSQSDGASMPHTGTAPSEPPHRVVRVRSRRTPQLVGCMPDTTPTHRRVGAPVASAWRIGRRVPSGSGRSDSRRHTPPIRPGHAS